MKKVGEIQSCGYILALKCNHSGNNVSVTAVSENMLNCSWVKLNKLEKILNRDINSAFDSITVSTLTTLLTKYRSIEETKLRMPTTATLHSRYQIMCTNTISVNDQPLCFSITQFIAPDVYMFEIEEVKSTTHSAASTPRKSQVRLSNNISKKIQRSLSTEEVTGIFCDTTMDILTDSDRIWTCQFMPDGSGKVINERIRNTVKDTTVSQLGKTLPNCVFRKPMQYLNVQWRYIYDVEQRYSAIYSYDDCADLSSTKFVTITEPCLMWLKGMGVRSALAVIIEINGTVWGMYLIHSIGRLMIPTHEQCVLLEYIASISALRLASMLRGDHFAHMSHAIRNPLYGVSSTLQILKSFGPSMNKSDSTELIKSALQCCQTMMATLSDTLNIDQETICNIGQTKINIYSFLSNVLQIMKPFAKCKSTTLNFCEGGMVSLPNDVPNLQALSVLGQEIRITQIVDNLVCNAIKFSPKNGSITLRLSYMPYSRIESYWKSVKSAYSYNYVATNNGEANINVPSLTTATNSVDGWLVILVEDTGFGISDSNIPILFNSFQQLSPTQETKSRCFGTCAANAHVPNSCVSAIANTSSTTAVTASTYNGSDGLGLHIVQEHIMAMDGMLAVASTVGIGTLFFCAFSAQPCQPERVNNVNEGNDVAHSHLTITNDSTYCNQQQSSRMDTASTLYEPENMPPQVVRGNSEVTTLMNVTDEINFCNSYNNLNLSTTTTLKRKHQPTSNNEFQVSDSGPNCADSGIADSTTSATTSVARDIVTSSVQSSVDAYFLVVDDSPMNLRLLQKKINLAFDKNSNVSICCLSAANGSIAVDTYKSIISDGKHQKLAGIFMDYHMPVCNGAVAIAQIRAIEKASPALRSVHIIGFTADVSESSNNCLLQSGASEIMPKPTPSGHVELICRRLVQMLKAGE